MLIQHILQGSLQEDITRILTRYITNNHLQNTLQRKPCCMLQLELQQVLQSSYTKPTTFY